MTFSGSSGPFTLVGEGGLMTVAWEQMRAGMHLGDFRPARMAGVTSNISRVELGPASPQHPTSNTQWGSAPQGPDCGWAFLWNSKPSIHESRRWDFGRRRQEDSCGNSDAKAAVIRSTKVTRIHRDLAKLELRRQARCEAGASQRERSSHGDARSGSPRHLIRPFPTY
jgi:hypothetical protein